MSVEGLKDPGVLTEVETVVLQALMAQRSLAQAPDLAADLACDLGLTSFDMMELCVRIEGELGRPVDFGALVGVRTAGDLVRAVEGSLAG